jgi:hypothetical protein
MRERGASSAASLNLCFIPPRRHNQGTDRADPEKDTTVGKHSLEKLTHVEQDGERQLQEAKTHHLANDRPTSAAEREMLYHTLVSHRMKLLVQGAELALRLGDILAEVERLDRQLGDYERPEFWRTAQD